MRLRNIYIALFAALLSSAHMNARDERIIASNRFRVVSGGFNYLLKVVAMPIVGKPDAIDLILDADFVKCWKLDSIDFQTFANDIHARSINHNDWLFSEAYQMDDGRVVVWWRQYGGGTIFANAIDYERTIKDVLERPSWYAPLYKRNPYGEHLPEYCMSLVKNLADTLDVPMGPIDADFLKKLDVAIEQRPDAIYFNRKHLLHYIAAIGLALIEKHGAVWRMELTRDSVTWHPTLIVRNQRVQFVENLYEDIFLTEKRESLSAPLLTEIYETTDMIIRFNLH